MPVSGLYVAAPEGDTGKSTVALGILHRLASTVARVGVFRPISRTRERARSGRKRIVLPEGDDDRILKAAGRVLQRGIADLTILGQENQIRSRAA